MKKILKLRKNLKGQSLVEVALVLPILMILVLGMIEFGWILNGKITLSNAAREGARFAVVSSEDAEVMSKTEDVVKNSMSGSSLIYVGVNLTGISEGHDSAKITAEAKIKPIVGLFFSDEFVNLSAKAEMRIEK